MKGFVCSAVAGLSLGAGMLALNGCAKYRDIVDPCYPERYNFVSRQTTREVFNTQANNGHILDQTVWNWYFETDKDGNPTALLNNAGVDHLDYLAKRRPAPDPKIYLQTAQDLKDLAKLTPDKVSQARGDLDGRRIVAVRNFLAGQMAGKAPVEFEIAVHDPAPIGNRLSPYTGTQQWDTKGALPGLYGNFRGVTDTKSGTLTTGGGGGGGSQ